MPAAAYVGSKLNNNATILPPGVPAVTINGNPASVLGDDVSDGHKMVEGSANVLVGGKPMVRKDDKDTSGHFVDTLISTDVFVNGE